MKAEHAVVQRTNRRTCEVRVTERVACGVGTAKRKQPDHFVS